jgi:hypothetical protein
MQSAGLLGRGISPLQGRYLHKEQYKQRMNANRHPCIEFDLNTRYHRSSEKTVHALDRASTVTVNHSCTNHKQSVAE